MVSPPEAIRRLPSLIAHWEAGARCPAQNGHLPAKAPPLAGWFTPVSFSSSPVRPTELLTSVRSLLPLKVLFTC